jgi:thiamine pyrophosphate-dependent acetolactate synthase large subunit-like protein
MKSRKCDMKVSDLFIKCLENEGVRYIFGLPGEEIEELIFSLGIHPFNLSRHVMSKEQRSWRMSGAV